MEYDETDPEEDKFDGWYFKKDGQTFGPVSPLEFKDLMASGRITHRQAVWKRETKSLLFANAATALKEKKLGLGPG